MNDLVLLVSGGVFALMMDWLHRFWLRSQGNLKRSEALAVLKRHGLTPQLYLATIGVEDTELRNALDEFAFSGHIIMNNEDEVVGKICPRVVKGPHLRLVVSND